MSDYSRNTLDETVEFLIPAMGFQVEVKGATVQKFDSGAEKISLRCKCLDTIPPGQYIDTEQFKNPLVDGGEGTTVFADIWLDTEKDDKAKAKGKIMRIKKWVQDFDTEGGADKKALAESFIDTVGGVVFKHEPYNRDEPDGLQKATISKSCPV